MYINKPIATSASAPQRLPALLRMSTLLALAFGVSLPAIADDATWYAGANVGQSRAKIDDARISASLLGSGFASTTIADDDSSTGFKLFGGYQFNRNFALEGGYFDLGKFGFRATTVPAGTLDGRIRLRGVNLDLVGRLPVTDKFSVFGRVGVNYADARDNFSGTGAVRVLDPNPRKHDANVKFGVGLQYDFTEALSMRAEAERYRINDAVGNKGDVDLFSVGLVYRFGGRTPTPVARVAMVEPPRPAPEPVVVAAPPPPPPPAAVPARVSFSADALFDFNRSSIKPAGKAALDKFATDLRGTSFQTIAVTGHTDRIGSHAYNLKLSAARAEAVKAYLASQGIAATMIDARGVDGADPVTKPGQCKGSKPTPVLIACLAPDRRVDVEVSGTR